MLMPQLINKIQGSLSVEMSSSLATGSTGRLKQFPSTIQFYTYQQVIPSPTNSTSYTCPSTGGCLLLTSLSDNASVEIKAQNVTMMIKRLQNI